MKKAISLLLALVLCLSLCACGGGNETPNTTEAPTETTAPEATKLTKEELLAKASSITNDEAKSALSNPAFAKSLVGNTYIIYGKVWNIEVDHLVIEIHTKDENGKKYIYGGDSLQIHAYIPNDDLIKATLGSMVAILGEINNIEQVKEEYVDASALIIENAYLVDETAYNP